MSKNTFSKLRSEKKLIRQKLDIVSMTNNNLECQLVKVRKLLSRELKKNKMLNKKLEDEVERNHIISEKLRTAIESKDSFYDYWVKEVEKISSTETYLKITVGVLVSVITVLVGILIKG